MERRTYPILLGRASITAPSLFFRKSAHEVVVSERLDAFYDRAINPDRARLGAMLTQLPPLNAASTLLDAVKRVPPGATIELRSEHDSVVATRAVNLGSPLIPVDPLTLATHMREAIVGAVERALMGARSVAVLTGGGVDSTVLMAIALKSGRARGIPVQAIALDFGGAGDDRPHLKSLEKALGFRSLRARPAEGAVYLTRFSEVLPYWSPTMATDRLLLERARGSGADVVLTGLGGDDLFDGSPPETLRGRFANRVPLAARRTRRLRKNRADFPWAGPELRSFLEAEARQFEPQDYSSPSARFAAIAQATYLLDSLELSDGLAREVGVKIAHPYLDDELVSNVSRFPSGSLRHGGRVRGLFRLAARGLVPDSVRLRSDKASFQKAMVEVLRAAGGPDTLREIANVDALAALGLVERAAFRRAFDAFAETWTTDELLWGTIWPALAVEAFLRARTKAGSP